MDRAKDFEHLEYSTKNGLVLITHNRYHFRKLDKDWRAASKIHGGIILCSMKFGSKNLSETTAVMLQRFIQERLVNLPPSFCDFLDPQIYGKDLLRGQDV